MMQALLLRRDRLQAALLTLSVLSAAAGCLLPWESLRVSAAGEPSHVTRLGVLHGTGIAAVAGSTLTLLLVAHRLARPGHSVARDIAVAAAGTLLALGTALFTMNGGYRPVETQTYAVTLGPGLVLCAVSGVALLAVAALSVRRTSAYARSNSATTGK